MIGVRVQHQSADRRDQLGQESVGRQRTDLPVTDEEVEEGSPAVPDDEIDRRRFARPVLEIHEEVLDHIADLPRRTPHPEGERTGSEAPRRPIGCRHIETVGGPEPTLANHPSR